MTILSWNTLFAGFDGNESTRRREQLELINDLKPDVVLMQEAKNYDLSGYHLLFETEASVNMRGFLGKALHTGQHTAIFVNPSWPVTAFEVDNSHFHHSAIYLTIKAPSYSLPITFVSVHLCPHSPEIRRREAAYLLSLAKPSSLSLIAGDFNSLSLWDPEPADWEKLSPHYKSRYFEGNAPTADRSVLEKFEAAGFIDCAKALGRNEETTVPTASYKDAEFVSFRCDYAMASKKLSQYLISYQVIKTALTESASDHYPILLEFTQDA